MEPIEYVDVFRRRWKVIAAMVVVGVALGWFTAPGRPPRTNYSATSVVVVNRSAGQGSAQAVDPLTAKIVEGFVLVGEVPKRAAAKVGFDGDPAVLAGQLQTEPDDTEQSIQITAVDPDPGTASAVANAFAGELVAFVGQRTHDQIAAAIEIATAQADELETRIAALEADLEKDPGNSRLKASTDTARRQLLSIGSRVDQLAALDAPGLSRVTLVRPGVPVEVAGKGFSPPTGRVPRAAVAGAVALLLGLGLALLIDRLDPKIRSKEQAERAFGLPVLSEVPKVRGGSFEIRTATHTSSAVAEAYRRLRTALEFMALPAGGTEPSPNGHAGGNGKADSASAPPHRRVFVVTSAGPREGKSTSVANLAAALAETGQRVLVISADTRRPSIHKYFDVADHPGLSEMAAANPGTKLAPYCKATVVPRVFLVPSGTPVENPAELSGVERDVLAQARKLADVVLVDTPPVLVTNDVSELLTGVDAVLLVAREGRTTEQAAQRASELLLRLRAPVVGVALIGSTGLPQDYSKYYKQNAKAAEGQAEVRVQEGHDGGPAQDLGGAGDRAAVS